MNLFENILKGILNEGAEIENIQNAISSHNAAIINYDSEGEDGEVADGRRTVYPVAYGLSLAGNPVIRGYQPNGDTLSKVPSWKLFRLDRILNFQPTDKTFDVEELPGINKSGDEGMSTVYTTALKGIGANTPITQKNIENDTVPTIGNTPISDKEVENPANTAKEIQPTSTPIANPLDNTTQKADIPSGINPELTQAPETKPVASTQLQQTPEQPQTTNQEPAPSQDTPTAPVYTDNTENGEEEEKPDEENVQKTLQEMRSLMKRMNLLK